MFLLARKLGGMTVAELSARISQKEYGEWQEYAEYREWEYERAAKKNPGTMPGMDIW
jgi:hypothetical protein